MAKKKTAKNNKTKPRLLKGGNPQIAKGYGNAPVQQYLSAIPMAWKKNLAKRLDVLITKRFPKVHKAVKWNSPFYGFEGDMWFLNFHCYTKYIKVAFFNGVELKPQPPGESKHKKVRYLDIYEGELDEAQFVKWVRQASKLPGVKM